MTISWHFKQMNLLGVLIAAASIYGFASSSLAQEVPKAVLDSLEVQKKVDLDNRHDDVKIMLDKIEILGRIEKPQTVFIIPGMDPTAGGIQIDRSFFKQIFRRIDKDVMRKRIAMSKRKHPLY